MIYCQNFITKQKKSCFYIMLSEDVEFVKACNYSIMTYFTEDILPVSGVDIIYINIYSLKRSAYHQYVL